MAGAAAKGGAAVSPNWPYCAGVSFATTMPATIPTVSSRNCLMEGVVQMRPECGGISVDFIDMQLRLVVSRHHDLEGHGYRCRLLAVVRL
ncbi:hypothetical protein RGCCGE502_25273 [Rhizobium grahamii CCGE 502]|uniref:Uncharacterized protein n=1 Tax=Rhizobium grahamii CCGE 502 TaxID=990285 RepID=S3H9K6_9HYPH|nr:hypothetical protein RGCCGE502_25273 [Rhizobium grahamii CCGE 502]